MFSEGKYRVMRCAFKAHDKQSSYSRIDIRGGVGIVCGRRTTLVDIEGTTAPP